ncbi:hypothetical protein OG417_11950 [Actinoallomurus sp. NBC_01490]|uniref:hypothetical protein n=1 Tax=Actinoallomurus sp. NBC_01490 TaxID=2903557 RepID=UPI002E376386|nr:hypothetical protein [Actinoallomurus sp. NBC_01490]
MPTVITGLAGAGPARPVPVGSALAEFGSALHVLRDPGHHGAFLNLCGVLSAGNHALDLIATELREAFGRR